MHGGHQAVLDAEGVVEDLGDGGQAVGGAGGVGHKGHAGIIGCIVDAHDEHGGVVLGRSGHNDLLGTGVDVSLGLLLGEEETGGLHHVLRADLAPGDLGGAHLGVDHHLVAIDGNAVLIILDGAVELAVDGVVPEHVGHIVGGHTGVVDADKLHVGAAEARAEYQAADSAEAVDTDLDAHKLILSFENHMGPRLRPLL
ncbi:Uncharacterised protein [uncultured Clostridium sp.]|nr:Uncharacterised protein [uncultured Clostridium sp.]